MLPEPTERLRFRPMEMADLDDVTAVLVAFDPMRGDRPPSTRDDAVRWIEWQERNYAEHDFGLWVVETHDGDLRRRLRADHAGRRGQSRTSRSATTWCRSSAGSAMRARRPGPYATARPRTASSTWSR